MPKIVTKSPDLSGPSARSKSPIYRYFVLIKERTLLKELGKVTMEEPILRYEKIDFLGEGQFATVYKARDVKTDKIVAVKKIKIGSRVEAQDGINRTALREIKLLQELQHPNLIGLLDVFGQKSNVSLVFDFMDTDLEIIVKDNNIVLTPANVKAYMIMTLKDGSRRVTGKRSNEICPNYLRYYELHLQNREQTVYEHFEKCTGSKKIYNTKNTIFMPIDTISFGDQKIIWDHFRCLEYLHQNWILHRDLKPNNLLINREGILKIGDFGLAKAFGSPTRINTHQVVTRWYRSPELLFGARQYGTGVDMWAIGCILAELLLRVPFLPGESDLDQLSRIFQVFGTPNEDVWPGMTSLTDYVQFKQFPPQPLRHIFSAASDDLIILLESLLTLYPPKRCDCTQALQMAYFSNKPAPTVGSKLPMPSNLSKVEIEKPSLKRKLLDNIDGGTLAKRLQF